MNNPLPFTVDATLAHSPQTVDALADALRTEARLLGDLTAIMRRQRESVAHDDLDGVDDSVFSTHRVLVTLQEARRRRRALNHVLGEGDDLSVVALEEFFDGEMPAHVATATNALREAALALQQEVSVNRRVLREAITAGDRQVQLLVGAVNTANGTPAAGPGSASPMAEGASGGRLIDRRI